jgi:tetratricopeptide (TPR) repeat protein
MELGQDLLRITAGEGFVPPIREVDLDGAKETYRRAIVLAAELGDDGIRATALREVGVVLGGRIRAWFVDQVAAGGHIPIAKRVAAGEVLEDLLPELPVAPLYHEAAGLFEQALELFEQVGDRRGAMSTIIAMGYLSWAPDIHLGSGSARHIEEIRRLTSKMRAFTNESERAAFETQMLYGVHVFARAKVVPDLAVSRGEEAYRHAHETGDRALEFLAAGGTAMAYLDLGEVDRARPWIDRAAAAAAENPTPLKARRLETWRGLARACAGDAVGMRAHLERAVELATESGQSAARCEALSTLAVAASRLGAERSDEALLDVAERAGREAIDLCGSLPGHPPWGARAAAALARVALVRGRAEEAAELAGSATESLHSAMHEDLELDVLLPAAAVFEATGALEWDSMRQYLQMALAMIAQRTLDEDVRVRWFRGPVGREMTRLAGPIQSAPTAEAAATAESDVEEADAALLRSLVQGKTNAEIAQDLDLQEEVVARRLGELFARVGASSRAEATAFAFRERVL